jgi:hypothetical protein
MCKARIVEAKRNPAEKLADVWEVKVRYGTDKAGDDL